MRFTESAVDDSAVGSASVLCTVRIRTYVQNFVTTLFFITKFEKRILEV